MMRSAPYETANRQRLRGGTPLERLMFRTRLADNGCWEWMGSRNVKGYGHVWGQGKVRFAHRLSYELHVGPIPDGLHVCHRCDNPPCVNPDHLFLGTNQENVDDAYGKGKFHGRRHPTAHEMPQAFHADPEEIRTMRDRGMSLRAIATAKGVSRRTIERVLDGTHWTVAA